LLVSPVLTAGATSVSAYFPAAQWYDWYTGAPQTKQGNVELNAPIDFIPIHIRGGIIIPTQTPYSTTLKTRSGPFTLLVPLDQNGVAEGSLFLDDGESLDTVDSNAYNFISFALTNDAETYTLTSVISGGGFSGINTLTVANATFLGVAKAPKEVSVNKATVTFTYDATNEKLVVANLALPLKSVFSISWI